MADTNTSTVPVLTPPPPTDQDAANAVPNVPTSTKDKVIGGIGSRASAVSEALGGLSGSRTHPFDESAVGKGLAQHHAEQLAQARMHWENAQTALTIKDSGVDPKTGAPLTPEEIADYTNRAKLSMDAFQKIAGVNKDQKALLQQKRGLFDIALQHGTKAVHEIMQKAKQLHGGGDGGDSSSGAAGASGASGGNGLTPPPTPGSSQPSAAPPATGGNAAVPPPPAPTPAPMDMSGQRAMMADRHKLSMDQATTDIQSAAKIKEAQAKPPATPFTSWEDAFKSEHGRTPTTKEIDDHQAATTSKTSATQKPLGPDRAANLNQTLTALAGGKLPPNLTLGPDSTQKDYDNAKAAIKELHANAMKEKPVDISPEAVDAFADIVMRGGTLPNLGLGGANARLQIINRVGQIASGKGKPSAGTGDQIVQNKAALTALTRELSGLQVQRGAVGAFENTALKNLELFEKTAEKIVDSGSPWVNKPLREVQAGGLGSDEVVAYNTARNVALTEIARVLSSPNMTGVLTNEQREEVGALVGPGATLSNVLAASKILKQDMENRKGSLDEELDAVRGQIKGGQKMTGPPSPSGAKGTVKMRAPNGQTKDVPTDRVEHYKSLGATVVQ